MGQALGVPTVAVPTSHCCPCARLLWCPCARLLKYGINERHKFSLRLIVSPRWGVVRSLRHNLIGIL